MDLDNLKRLQTLQILDYFACREAEAVILDSLSPTTSFAYQVYCVSKSLANRQSFLRFFTKSLRRKDSLNVPSVLSQRRPKQSDKSLSSEILRLLQIPNPA